MYPLKIIKLRLCTIYRRKNNSKLLYPQGQWNLSQNLSQNEERWRLKRGHEFEMEFLRGHENGHFHALGMIMRFSCPVFMPTPHLCFVVRSKTRNPCVHFRTVQKYTEDTYKLAHPNRARDELLNVRGCVSSFLYIAVPNPKPYWEHVNSNS